MNLKRIVAILGALIILVAVLAIVKLVTPIPQPGAKELQFVGFPVDQVRAVDFDANPDELQAGWVEENHPTKNGKISRRDLLDQYRDWLLISIISSLNLPLDSLNKALYDLPAARTDHLRRVASIESGETRSALIGEGEVIALIPAGATLERLDHLARIADEQRKNLGDIPAVVHIFEYEIIPEEQFARVTRRPSLEGKTFFTEKYGYREQPVASLDGFRSFMGSIDDITYARKEGSELVLGGRKLLSRPYRGIRVEDVATVWKSETDWSNRQGSGFSLDPRMDFDQLMSNFIILSLLPEVQQTFGKDALEKARRAIEAKNEKAFHSELIKGCRARGIKEYECKGLASDFLWFGLIQAARYDGKLQGTEVGMVLFYTDLLMKLWAQDFANAAPKSIEGFAIRPDIIIPAIYKQELENLSQSRLWLGSLDGGFQIGQKKYSISYARNATRIFAVPHDYLTNADHTTEIEPNYPTRLYVTWWNNHFEEVARFEPEYERLNEIMKWSQLIGWLNASGDSGLLGFLREVPDEKPQWFSEWVRKHPELTFRKWDTIGFLPRGHASISTEVLPILYSPEKRLLAFKGGVSLARREAISSRAPLAEKVSPSARRGAVDFQKSDPTKGRLQMLDKREFTFKPVQGNTAKIVATTAPEVRLRGIFGEIKNTGFETTVERTTQRFVLKTRAAGAEVGELRISPSQQGFKVGWLNRDIVQAQSMARRLSLLPDFEDFPQVLRSDPAVKSVVLVPGKGVYAEMKGSGRWHRFQPGSRDSQVVSEGFQARIADASPAARPIDVAWMEKPGIPADLPGESFIMIKPASTVTEAPVVEFGARGPPQGVSSTYFDFGTKRISGHLDHKTGSYYLRLRDLPPDLQGNPRQIANLVTPGGGAPLETARLQQILGRRDYGRMAREAAADPGKYQARSKAFLEEQIKLNNEYLARGRFDLASRQMNEMIFFYGKQPDLMARRGLAELSAGKPERAIASLQETAPTPMREVIFDEVNHRIQYAAGNKPAQENLRQFAVSADWHNYRVKGKPAGELRPVVREKRITHEYATEELPRGKTTDLETVLADKNAPVYIQDGAAINNREWSPSVHASLREPLAANRVAIYELDTIELGQFHPDVVFVTNSKTTLRLANQGYLSQQSQGYTSLSQTLQGDDEEKRKRRLRAYLVVAR